MKDASAHPLASTVAIKTAMRASIDVTMISKMKTKPRATIVRNRPKKESSGLQTSRKQLVIASKQLAALCDPSWAQHANSNE